MPRLEFVRQSAKDTANPQATSERLVNFYPERIASGGRASFALKSVPGSAPFASLPGVFVRALSNAPYYDDDGRPHDRLVALSSGGLHRIDELGATELVGAVDDDEAASISSNNGAVTIVSGGAYYLWGGAALTQPTPGVFSAFGSVEFLGEYTILTELNDRRFCWSDLADPGTLPALNFATAEGRDDIILRAVSIAGNLWLFKTTSIEIWALTGGGGADAFTRVGQVIETGLKDFGLVAKIPGGAFFVGDDGIVYLSAGAEALQAISTPAVNEAIRAGGATACFFYEDAGHKFAVLRFRDRPAWVYDLATGIWHERATGEAGAWGASCAAQSYGAWRLGGFDGAIRTAVRSNDDAGEALIRRAISAPLEVQGRQFRVPMVEVFGQSGQSSLGRAAAVMLRFSRDGGMTWGEFRTGSFGALGQYRARAVFRNCGLARVLAAEIRVTDPADLTILSAAEVQVA